VFPVEIYNQFLGETGTNFSFAAAISVIAILLTAAFFLAQRYLSRRFAFTMNALHPIEKRRPRGLFSVLIHLSTYVVVGLSFLPQVYIVYQSFQNTSGKLFKPGYSLASYQTAIKRMSNAIPNTFIIGARPGGDTHRHAYPGAAEKPVTSGDDTMLMPSHHPGR
jgi:iron(III) transport system permease protein